MKANIFTFRSLKEKPAITSVLQVWFPSFLHITKWKLQSMHLQLLLGWCMDCWLLLIVVAICLWCFRPVLFSLSQTQTKQCEKQTMRGQRASVVWCFHFSNWRPWYSKLYFILKEVNVRHVALLMVNKHHCIICVISHNGNMSPTCICHVERGFHDGAVCITRAVDSRIPWLYQMLWKKIDEVGFVFRIT